MTVHVASHPQSRPGAFAVLADLTKLKISGASVTTLIAGYVACARTFHWGVLTACLGTLLLAMGSCALNEVQERHFDARMPRTAGRPIPAGILSAAQATAIGALLGLAGFGVLLAFHGWTTALLGALALGWYNGVYTPLKRITPFAVVPGALIGALPPAIGWAAAGGHPAHPAILAIALVYFVWQVPHFWLLASLHAEGYHEGGFPTLAKVFEPAQVARLTFTWTCATAAGLGLLPLFGGLGSRWLLGVLGLAALWLVLRSTRLLRREPDAAALRSAFMDINVFALVLTVALVADPWVR